jgi:hypothetical protein
MVAENPINCNKSVFQAGTVLKYIIISLIILRLISSESKVSHAKHAPRTSVSLRTVYPSHLRSEPRPRNAIRAHVLVVRDFERDGAHGHASDPAACTNVPKLVLDGGHHHGEQLLRPLDRAVPAAEHQDRPELLQLGRVQLRSVQSYGADCRDGHDFHKLRHLRPSHERSNQPTDTSARTLVGTTRDHRAVRILFRTRRPGDRIQLRRPLRTQHRLSRVRSVLRNNSGGLPEPTQLLQRRFDVLGSHLARPATALLDAIHCNFHPAPCAELRARGLGGFLII